MPLIPWLSFAASYDIAVMHYKHCKILLWVFQIILLMKTWIPVIWTYCGNNCSNMFFNCYFLEPVSSCPLEPFYSIRTSSLEQVLDVNRLIEIGTLLNEIDTENVYNLMIMKFAVNCISEVFQSLYLVSPQFISSRYCFASTPPHTVSMHTFT